MTRYQDQELAEMFATLMGMARFDAGVSLRTLAEELTLGPGAHSYLSRIERGVLVPSFPMAVHISRALKMDLAILL